MFPRSRKSKNSTATVCFKAENGWVTTRIVMKIIDLF
jgi:hypothetical protein